MFRSLTHDLQPLGHRAVFFPSGFLSTVLLPSCRTACGPILSCPWHFRENAILEVCPHSRMEMMQHRILCPAAKNLSQLLCSRPQATLPIFTGHAPSLCPSVLTINGSHPTSVNTAVSLPAHFFTFYAQDGVAKKSLTGPTSLMSTQDSGTH